jgi:DNA polymerase II large subunit
MSGSGIHRKSVRFRVARRNMKAKPACIVTEKRRTTGKEPRYLDTEIRPKRYREWRELITRAEETLIPIEERLGKKQGEESAQYKEGPKGNIVIALDDAQGDQADADDRTSERTDHNGEERWLLAKKRTDHRQQLDIATSHSLLAEKIRAQPGQEPEDAASHGETGHRIDHTHRQDGHCAQKSDHYPW